jgi:uncharacterized membrane protein
MKEFLLTSPAQAVIWSSALLVLTAVSIYVVGKFRGRTDKSGATANELLTNFRELHHQGDINDAEFRTIKNVLGVRLQRELKSTERKD